MNDLDLLRQYLANGDQRSFEELVTRHLDWVYSSALRQVRNVHLAEDVTQAVFLAMWRQAAKLAKGVVLDPWLFQVTRNASITALRSDRRRRKHEREAAAMALEVEQGMSEEQWQKLSAVLDEVVEGLGKKDRLAVLMRFYERKSFAEIGSALGISEDAADKRVTRALAKLREMLGEKGLAFSGAALAAGMLANTTQAAPAGLGGAVVATAMGGMESAGVVGGIAKGAIKMMAWAKVKVVAAVAAVLIGGSVVGVLTLAQTAVEDRVADAPRTTRPDSKPVVLQPTTSPQGMRMLQFPKDRSLGAVLVLTAGTDPRDEGNWSWVADARGQVNVPPGVLVRLNVSQDAANDLSPLAELGVGDLYSLSLFLTAAGPGVMEPIAKLTGLKDLMLRGTAVDEVFAGFSLGRLRLHRRQWFGVPWWLLAMVPLFIAWWLRRKWRREAGRGFEPVMKTADKKLET